MWMSNLQIGRCSWFITVSIHPEWLSRSTHLRGKQPTCSSSNWEWPSWRWTGKGLPRCTWLEKAAQRPGPRRRSWTHLESSLSFSLAPPSPRPAPWIPIPWPWQGSHLPTSPWVLRLPSLFLQPSFSASSPSFPLFLLTCWLRRKTHLCRWADTPTCFHVLLCPSPLTSLSSACSSTPLSLRFGPHALPLQGNQTNAQDRPAQASPLAATCSSCLFRLFNLQTSLKWAVFSSLLLASHLLLLPCRWGGRGVCILALQVHAHTHTHTHTHTHVRAHRLPA